ncbi:50S ribosomal protein L7ae-like protein [Salisediminibacterium halotolerans]|uniref:50S ribosomal protein L7ae-like protein n=1 Tax=Salisediminibacterium halotolerans TaxID=517425 RepID=UPI000EB11FC2|nr:50S ribosomal protein L7ae-like protein [Salisediminibacterium halotolerans]RLJ73070.1 LSU ribosomal protein L7AE [Actinophytocola xinjiangensis]RPE86492.1 LSU ribosomal protein L7AE [Salisediminibacterium halotolerans]TWG33867.1 LSU ribosomal protein L7AE [Salisediminibacterium halotolerans]
MSYEKVAQATNKVVGTKQTLKALEHQQVKELIVAEDADPDVLRKVLDAADSQELLIERVDSMKKLGKACGIDVNAAIVAIKK